MTSRTDLAFYSGEDALTLPLLSVGAVGVVGTSTHFTGALTKQMIEAYEAGDIAGALALHRQLLPLFTGIFRTQGTILVKAGLAAAGPPGRPGATAAGGRHRRRDWPSCAPTARRRACTCPNEQTTRRTPRDGVAE